MSVSWSTAKYKLLMREHRTVCAGSVRVTRNGQLLAEKLRLYDVKLLYFF